MKNLKLILFAGLILISPVRILAHYQRDNAAVQTAIDAFKASPENRGTVHSENDAVRTVLARRIAESGELKYPIDFSCAGFGGGGNMIPQVKVVLLVKPSGEDDTKQLQSAIDYIGTLPLDTNGFRGALQLYGGQFKIFGQIHLGQERSCYLRK